MKLRGSRDTLSEETRVKLNPLEEEYYSALLAGGAIAAGVVFVALFFISAPYGRHVRASWGPTVNAALGWTLMESVAVLAFAVCFLLGNRGEPDITWIFFILWQIHYVHRAVVYPLRRKHSGTPMPLVLVGMAILFNTYNGYLNGRYLGVHGENYDASWISNPRFLCGVGLFFLGLSINIHADSTLRNLRKDGGRQYKIPYGGLYRWVSCPNYFGEILEWTGWALATWSFSGLAFLFYSSANLVPRAISNHRWYKNKFVEFFFITF